MNGCVICAGERDRDLENNLLCCSRCAGRLSGALRQIPVLVDELHGLGYVERDTRPKECRSGGCLRPAGWRGVVSTPGRPVLPYCGRHAKELLAQGWLLSAREVAPTADPVAAALTAGPIAGASTGPRAAGTRERSLPIRVDPTDLLARPRYGSLLVAGRTPYPDDQVGHLAVATVLDFWVRDWADLRGEGLPPLQTAGERSPGGLLARWLADRLDWALREHPALDEFAGDVSDLLGALWGLAGHGAARPKLMEAACPSCSLLTLVQPYPDASIECTTADCQRIITPEEYAEWVRTLINETTA